MLRIFGLEDNAEIADTFNDVDTGEIKYLQNTLKKDSAKSVDDSYIEIYKRIRPGDLATPENAKSLIDAMLTRFDRYDLSQVGRFKVNQRLGLNSQNRMLITGSFNIMNWKKVIFQRANRKKLKMS